MKPVGAEPYLLMLPSAEVAEAVSVPLLVAAEAMDAEKKYRRGKSGDSEEDVAREFLVERLARDEEPGHQRAEEDVGQELAIISD